MAALKPKTALNSTPALRRTGAAKPPFMFTVLPAKNAGFQAASQLPAQAILGT
jgi:hypothetical protein